MSPFTDFLETVYGMSLEVSQSFLAHSFSAKNICQIRSKAKMKGETDNKVNALEPTDGFASSDNSDDPHDVSGPRNGSDDYRDDISEFHDASEPRRTSDDSRPDDESERRNIAADLARMACDTSSSSITVGNNHTPGSGTDMNILMGASAHGTVAADPAKIMASDTSNNDMAVGNGWHAPGSGTQNLAGASEYGTTASADPITSRPDLVLPGMFATAGSQMPELSNLLEWQPRTIGGGDNFTNHGLSHGFAPAMMSMGTSEHNFDAIEPSAGMLGEQNPYGYYYAGENWAGWIANKPNISFLDPMVYYSGYTGYQPVVPPQLETVQPPSASAAPGLAPLIPLPSSPADLPREQQHASTGTSHGPEHSTLDLLPLPSSPADSPREEQRTATGPSRVPERSTSSSETIGSPIPDDSDTTEHPRVTTPLPANETTEPRAPSEKSSRFGRAIIPSTRLEKMNEIGSSKENTPPVAPRQAKEWVTSAKEHLLGLNLGEEWKLCVDTWLAVEASLDYGGKTKVSLTSHI